MPQSIATKSNPIFNNLTVNNINGKVGNDLVTGPASAVNNDLCSFNITGKIIQDSGILATNLFLKDGSVTATGNFNMGTKEINNFAALRPQNTNLNIGNTTTMPASSNGTINIGDFTTSTGDSSVNIGLSNIARANSVAIGKETVAGVGATVIGYRSSCGTRADTIVIGRDNLSFGANGADIIGVNQSNSTSNSLLLGNGLYANIRASGAVCDLGTSAIPFQTLYSNASVAGTANSRLTNDIVSNTSTGVLNNIVSFVSDKVIEDSGITAASITGGPFLPLAGGTMNLGVTINANAGAITN